MTQYLTTYNAVDLYASCGISTPRVSGVHDLPTADMDIQYLPGANTAHVKVMRHQMRNLHFDAACVGVDHAAMVNYLGVLKRALMADDDFHPLVVTDRSGQQIQAKATGFPVDISSIPAFVRGVRFPLDFIAYPYWEDVSLVSAHYTSSPQAIANGGDMSAYPTYTCELVDNMAGGLTFTLGSVTFTYNLPLVIGDSLVITTDQALPDVKKNGTRAWAGVPSTWPNLSLAVGNNTLTFDSTKFHMTVAFRRRYW